MTNWKFLIIWFMGQAAAQLNDYGSCVELPAPIASHPTRDYHVTAGNLSVWQEGGEVVVRAHCHEDRGFFLLDQRFREMRCSYNARSREWHWNHYHRDRASPPPIRCAYVSPKPVKLRFRYGQDFAGCSLPDPKENILSSIKENLICVQTEDCMVSNMSCNASENGTVLSVTVASRALKSLTEQRQILETAADYLRSYPLSLHFLIPNSSSGAHSRKKRFDTSDFENADTEDVTQTDCASGQIQNSDETCTTCTAGTYAYTADENAQVCTACALDTYSAEGATECIACASGLGTLDNGSDEIADCIAVCIVPTMKFVASTDPESRVAEGGNVDMNCDGAHTYGNAGSQTIVCSSSTNNFPASCRKVTVSAPSPSIKSGDSGVVSCVVEAHDVGAGIQWFKGDSVTPLVSDNSAYTIATTLAVAFEADGKTKKSTSDLSILNFDSADADSYSCRVDYADPILDDQSAEQALAILGLVVAQSSAQIMPAAESFELSCSMNLDEIYVMRTVTWKHNGGDNISSGVTTSTSDSAYNSVLSFSSLALADTGIYTCTATYSHSDGSNAVILTGTIDVTVIGFETDPTGVAVNQGSEVVISCVVVGYQQATITWTKDGSAVSGDIDTYDEANKKTTSTVTIASATTDNGGMYKCTADFRLPTPTVDSASAIVSVYDIGITKNPANVVHAVGEVAELSCTVKNPDGATPSLSWYKVDGETTAALEESHINFDSANPGISTLTFSPASMENAGVYKCEAIYIIGEATITKESTTATLYIRGLKARLDTKYYSIGDAVTMECSLGVGSDGIVPATTAWYKDYFDDSSTPIADTDPFDVETETSVTNGLFKTTLTIKTAGITTENAGRYRCIFVVSENENYHSEGTLVVRIVTKTPTDANIYSYTNVGLKLCCTLDASDAQSGITWTGPDGVIDHSQYSNEESNDNIHILFLASSDSSGEYKCTFAFVEGISTVPEGVFSNVNLNLIEMVSPVALYSTYGAGVIVTLSCQVKSPSQLELRFHNGFQDLAALSTKHEGGKTKAEYVITVDAANKGGTFTCRKSELEFSPTSSTLTVFTISTPLLTATRGNSGDTVNLVCVADSHADITAPTFTWLLGDSAATETADANVVAEDSSMVSSTLPIIISSTTDASVYKCIVTYTGLAAGSNLESTTNITMNKILTSSTETVQTLAEESVTFSCVATAADTVDIKWRKKAPGWTAEAPTFDTLTGEQDSYSYDAGTRKSILTLTSPTTTDTSDNIECYDAAIGIYGVMALEVIGKPVSLRVWIGSGVAVFTCIMLVLAGACITKKKSKERSAGTENEFKLNGPVSPTPDHFNNYNDDVVLDTAVPSNLYSDTPEIISHRSGKLNDDTIIQNKTASA